MATLLSTTVNGTITTSSHGTSANWKSAYDWGNHAGAGYQSASGAITTSNIGSQSVNYASSAGNADTVDGYHATAFPYRSSGSSGYYQVGDWMQFNTTAGIYWPSYNGAHIYPNTSTSYGSIRIDGTRSSWRGITFDGSITLMMNDNESGHYKDGYGWQFRWSDGAMYISTGSYGGGTERTVIHSGNIGSQSVNYASSAGSVAWGNVSSRPTALSSFTNDLGNYGGWITSSGSISGNAATVTVNSGNGSSSWYPILWHSGNNVYSSSGTAEIYPAGGYGRFQYINTTDNDESGITRFVIKNGDSYHRSATTTVAADIIRGVASGSWSITAARATRANGNFYIDDNYGNTVVGVYTSTRFQGVFAMGDSYKLAADGSNCANHYGIAWSHPNAGGEAGNLTNHGMLVQNVGRTWTAISDTIWCIGDIKAFSDARVKTNIEVIDNPLERLSKVRGVTFNRTDLEHKDKRYAGVIAQEMRDALPEAVSENANGELSVSYGNTVSLLIESIKAQQVQIEELKAEVKKLRGE